MNLDTAFQSKSDVTDPYRWLTDGVEELETFSDMQIRAMLETHAANIFQSEEFPDTLRMRDFLTQSDYEFAVSMAIMARDSARNRAKNKLTPMPMYATGDHVMVFNPEGRDRYAIGTVKNVIMDHTYPYKVEFPMDDGDVFIQEYKATELYKVVVPPLSYRQSAMHDAAEPRYQLLKLLKPKDAIYFVQRAATRYSLIVFRDNQPFAYPNWSVAKLLGLRLNHGAKDTISIRKFTSVEQVARDLGLALFADAHALKAVIL